MTDAQDPTEPSSLPPHGHEPVLMAEVLAHLDPPESPLAGKTAIDCTLGRGGHALELAKRLGDGLLIGTDVDPENLAAARERIEAAGLPCRLHLEHANFETLPDVLAAAGVSQVDALLADLGVSTNQLLEGEHGLGFNEPEAPLDMRLDPRIRESAADLLRRWDEKRIADVLYFLAQERYSRRIARRIVETRRASPIETTGDLAGLVRRCVPRFRGAKQHVDPATRTFMALRMAVNRELDVLGALLSHVPRVLAPGGRAAVISFHSGEDRLVKNAFRDAAGRDELELVTRKPIVPGEAEVAQNPRSRSAKLRVARRLE